MPIEAPPHPALTLEPDGRLAVRDGNRYLLRLLDDFQFEKDGRALPIPHSAKRLLAYLGVRGKSPRTEIAAALWPGVPESRAQASLRTVLWRVHRLIPDAVVVGREELALASTVDADVQAFVAAAQRIVHEADSGYVRSYAPVLPAIGELLPGWYDDWVLIERERLRQLQIRALETAARQLTLAGRYAEAIEVALATIRLEPLRESATRALITAHLAEHNVVEAVRCFESFRAGLQNELGVKPTPDLERLVQSGLSRHG